MSKYISEHELATDISLSTQESDYVERWLNKWFRQLETMHVFACVRANEGKSSNARSVRMNFYQLW